MRYIKLIALKIDDFQSSVFYEDNYGLNQINEAQELKAELNGKGYYCVLANIESGMSFKN